MILAKTLQDAMSDALQEATATGRRQRITIRWMNELTRRRRESIWPQGVPRTWFMVEPAAPPRRRDALNDLPPELLDPIGMTPARPAGVRIPLGDIDFGRRSRV